MERELYEEIKDIQNRLERIVSRYAAGVMQDSHSDADSVIIMLARKKTGLFECDLITASDAATYLHIYHNAMFNNPRLTAKSAGYLLRKVPSAVKLKCCKPHEAGSGTMAVWCLDNHANYANYRQIDKYMLYSAQFNNWLKTLSTVEQDEFLRQREQVRRASTFNPAKQKPLDFF